MAAIQIVLQTSLGCCGLWRGALSWQLSAKSPSETQRKRGGERREGPSSGPHSVDGKHRLAAADAPPNPTALSGDRPASGAAMSVSSQRKRRAAFREGCQRGGSPASLTGQEGGSVSSGPSQHLPSGAHTRAPRLSSHTDTRLMLALQTGNNVTRVHVLVTCTDDSRRGFGSYL